MSNQRIEAVYERGTFRPIVPLVTLFREGQHVQLIVESAAGAQAYLDLATQVFEGLSDEDVAAIETMARRRSGFFAAGERSTGDVS
jgi:predicted DNA-binding antitoxin AbrB/MazE fold protein